VHGFDEFYGNLYHLNTEEEPELRDVAATTPASTRATGRAAC
jgi:arylsulfatase A-like enzyme